MNNTITFSIIMPVYNREGIVEQTIQSVLRQSYRDYELIIVDDGSTDNTEEVIKNISDEKISYYKIKNSERGAARNFGVKKAKNDYVAFLDSDDLLYPHHLSVAYQNIDTLKCPEVFSLNYDVKNAGGI